MDREIRRMLTEYVLTAAEAVGYTGCSYSTLMQDVGCGELPSHKTGTTRCFYRADLDRWLERRALRPERRGRPCGQRKGSFK